MELPDIKVIWSDPNLWLCVMTIWLPPLMWNIIARFEFRTKFLTAVFRGNSKMACTALAICIIALTSYKSYRFNETIDSQPRCSLLHENWILWSGYVLIYAGMLLVISSFFALGFFGTYLGDYFGILMEEKVTGFPFNFVNNPMYVGSTLNFLGISLIRASSAGLFLTLIVALVYYIAIRYEEPFTEEIYREKDKQS